MMKEEMKAKPLLYVTSSPDDVDYVVLLPI
jgi:hypothetical protein